MWIFIANSASDKRSLEAYFNPNAQLNIDSSQAPPWLKVNMLNVVECGAVLKLIYKCPELAHASDAKLSIFDFLDEIVTSSES